MLSIQPDTKRDFRDGYHPDMATYRPDAMPRNSVYGGHDVTVRRGGIKKRYGLSRFNVHPIGYTALYSCDVVEGWGGLGVYDEIADKKEGDAAKGIMIDGSGNYTINFVTAAKNLSGSVTDRIEFWLKNGGYNPTKLGERYNVTQIRMRLYSVNPTDYFQIIIPQSATSLNWKKFTLARTDFTSTGSPNWASIVEVEFRATVGVTIIPPPPPTGVLIDDIILNPNIEVTGIIDYTKKDATQKVLAVGGTKVYESTVNHTSWADLVTGLTAGLRLANVIYNDHLIAGNGSDNNFKYKAAKTSLGFTGPPAAPTFSANINGTMVAGTYFYRFVYVNSGTAHKSNPSPASAALTSLADPNDGIRITIPLDGACDGQIDQVHVFRTLMNAPVNSEYYRVPGTVVFNNGLGAAPTFDDTYPDVALLDELLEFDHDVPPKFNIVASDDSYVYYVSPLNPSRVWRSKYLDPESVPVTSYTEVSPDDGDRITALVRMENGQVVAFKRNSKYRIVGDLYLVENKLINERGTLNPYTAIKTPVGVIYQDDHSIWLYDGSSDNNLGRPLRAELETIAATTVVKGFLAYDQADHIIRCFMSPGGSAVISREYAFDLTENNWSAPYYKSASAAGNVRYNTVNYDLIGTYNGYIYNNDESTANDDDGAAISGSGKTPFINLSASAHLKKFREVILWLSSEGDYNLKVRFIKGYAGTVGNEVIIPLKSGSIWGTFIWGVDRWGTEEVLRVRVPIPFPDQVGPAIQMEFFNDGLGESFGVLAYEVLGQVMRKRG